MNRRVQFDVVRASNIELTREDTLNQKKTRMKKTEYFKNILKDPVSKKVLKDINFIEFN